MFLLICICVRVSYYYFVQSAKLGGFLDIIIRACAHEIHYSQKFRKM